MIHWAGIILAAGEGVRMKSRTPKAMHRICGKEMIRYPVELLQQLGVSRIVVVVSDSTGPAIQELLGDSVEYVTQPRVLGTGDAVGRAAKFLSEDVENILVQNADVPLVKLDSMQRLVNCHASQANQMTMLTVGGILTNDLGRVIRDDLGQVTDIVEAANWRGPADAPAEVNVGTYCFQIRWLKDNLNRIEPSSKGETYLTSLATIGSVGGDSIQGLVASDPTEMLGVNNRVQLAQVESVQRQRILENLMLSGVTIQDPASVYIDADVVVGQDSFILPNTVLAGRTIIGENCVIGPNSTISDSSVGERCRVTASMLEDAVMESDVTIGPFSHLRPGAHLESSVHLGNFVEVKNSRIGAGSASGHFSYLGDASIGAMVNIGAGTITCNYDGINKLDTVIGAGAFIGCDTMLVAPVSVGADAVTGAGSVVIKNIPEGRLAVGVPARILGKTPNKS